MSEVRNSHSVQNAKPADLQPMMAAPRWRLERASMRLTHHRLVTLAEPHIPENEPGSSTTLGKINPTQAEALTMIAVQVVANDVAVGFGGAGGYLEMNDGCTNFRRFLVECTRPNRKKIAEYVDHSLMRVTALAPVIGYDKASKIAHHASEHDLTLKEAALQPGFVDGQTFERVVEPAKMVKTHVAALTLSAQARATELRDGQA